MLSKRAGLILGLILGAVGGLSGLLGGCASKGVGSDEMLVGCLAEPQPGHCQQRQRRYYYDFRDDRCKTFIYSGCGGFVPFETLEDCRRSCGVTQ